MNELTEQEKRIAVEAYVRSIKLHKAGHSSNVYDPILAVLAHRERTAEREPLVWERSNTQRKDIVGQRTLPDGRIEYLCHNEALCSPYYTAVSGPSPVAGEAQSQAPEDVLQLAIAIRNSTNPTVQCWLDLDEESRQDYKTMARAALSHFTSHPPEGLVRVEDLLQIVDQFQEISSWAPGESRNALVCEIRDKIRSRLAPAREKTDKEIDRFEVKAERIDVPKTVYRVMKNGYTIEFESDSQREAEDYCLGRIAELKADEGSRG